MNIFLIGLPGSGKTTAARELARLLGKVFIDTDQEITKREGRAVGAVFEQDGEPTFRALETQVLTETLQEAGAVVATGGGLPCTGDNMERISEQGLVIWMRTPLAICTERIIAADAPYRPTFKGMDADQVLRRLTDLYTTRRHVYERADIVIHDAYVLSKIASLIRIPAGY